MIEGIRRSKSEISKAPYATTERGDCRARSLVRDMAFMLIKD